MDALQSPEEAVMLSIELRIVVGADTSGTSRTHELA